MSCKYGPPLTPKHIFTPNPIESISCLNRVNGTDSEAILVPEVRQCIRPGGVTWEDASQLWLPLVEKEGGREEGRKENVNMKKENWERNSEGSCQCVEVQKNSQW